ncbi:3340_t:CDS:2 [Dentiscutata heterogama]|uniref:3340_t:CDS:1 n=1 Tax=Dentiscutata heterogama TaxID=1316150 RepID=A0ACA9L9J7_9GLOM|nr:3340_t:CDS:2 [Dentiscutata heterogama]
MQPQVKVPTEDYSHSFQAGDMANYGHRDAATIHSEDWQMPKAGDSCQTNPQYNRTHRPTVIATYADVF